MVKRPGEPLCSATRGDYYSFVRVIPISWCESVNIGRIFAEQRFKDRFLRKMVEGGEEE